MSLLRLSLFQPEIPQNAGTLLRLGACLGVGIDVIEPCGFVWNDRKLKRSGMDYLEWADMQRHASWEIFRKNTQGRIILLDVKGSVPYTQFSFEPTDCLLLGRESSGVPEEVMQTCHASVCIPQLPDRRSLNVAIAAAMVLGEALRQTGGFPKEGP